MSVSETADEEESDERERALSVVGVGCLERNGLVLLESELDSSEEEDDDDDSSLSEEEAEEEIDSDIKLPLSPLPPPLLLLPSSSSSESEFKLPAEFASLK